MHISKIIVKDGVQLFKVLVLWHKSYIGYALDYAQKKKLF